MKQILNYLTKISAKEYCKLTGNGTAALYISLKALGLKNKNIAIPNNVCYSVPLAVILSGNIPYYIDVDMDDLGISPDLVNKNISHIEAVIAVHAYGNVCKIDKLGDICKRNNIPLIEDCAVSLGAKKKGKDVGCYGDLSIYSFGAGKIIDVDHGGAVLTNNKNLFDEISILNNELPEYRKSLKQESRIVGTTYKNFYNRYYLEGELKELAGFHKVVTDEKITHFYQYSEDFNYDINSEINTLEQNLNLRRENALKLSNRLKNTSENISTTAPDEGTAIWRYNIFINKNRNDILKNFLQKKYKVSSWFPSVSLFFNKLNCDVDKTKNSDWVGDHILNLWVNKEIDDNYITTISKDILEFNPDEIS